MNNKCWLWFLILMLAGSSVLAGQNQQVGLCAQPLSDQVVIDVFKKNTLKQLALEFGENGLFVYDIEHFAVDQVLSRVEAYAKYPRPGQKSLSTMRVEAWVSRCQGTTIIRGNSWLADGTLVVPRYAAKDLVGEGLGWGDPNAPMRFIVYLDSRCPHCHRLISYAKKLVDAGKVFLDIRQVAYLEEIDEAITDTRLLETSLILNGVKKITDDEYLDLLSGFPNEAEIEMKGAAYDQARVFLQSNTKTARDLLHIITVPAVFIQEREHNNHYRQMGYWEINRIFQ
ncbi:thioredoxin domain-containing protein [Kaarinaea lacus]